MGEINNENIPFPEITIKIWDMAKGIGEVALELVTKRFITEPKPTQSDHYGKVTEV